MKSTEDKVGLNLLTLSSAPPTKPPLLSSSTSLFTTYSLVAVLKLHFSRESASRRCRPYFCRMELSQSISLVELTRSHSTASFVQYWSPSSIVDHLKMGHRQTTKISSSFVQIHLQSNFDPQSKPISYLILHLCSEEMY